MTDLADWPALVLTAGLATRLRPLSDVRAKAAMPVAGAPLIARILRWLHAAGVRRAVLNLHHRPETIAAVVGDGSQFGVDVRYSWEPEVLGSAGGPRHALPLLDADRFLVVNGDTITDCRLPDLVAEHVRTRARVTLAVVEGDVRRYGGALMDGDGRVLGFGKPDADTRARHFIGVQAVDADVFSTLPDGVSSETVKTLYPRLIADAPGSVRAWESEAEFLDVGTARDYFATVEKVAAREGRPLDIGTDCRIAEGAAVDHAILWDRVTIGHGARIVNCILADDVTIPAGATYENRVVVNRGAGDEPVYSVAL